MQFIFSLICACLLTSVSFAQSTTTFYIKDEIRVDSKEEADFIRKVTGPLDDGKNYRVEEYYKNDTLKLKGISSSKELLNFAGPVTRYYENGRVKSVINYKNQVPEGEARYFYSNGKLRKLVFFEVTEEPDKVDKHKKVSKARVSTILDTAGNKLVADGNGYAKDVDDYFEVTEEGNYKDGKKAGRWTGKNAKEHYQFEEDYQNGQLMQGQSVLSDGTVVKYKKIELQPEFQGGLSEFLGWVGRNYNYPAAAFEKGISGKLVLSFVIEPTGELTRIKVMKDPGLGTAEEGVKLLKKSPNWSPGAIRGMVRPVEYFLPIMLNLR